MLFGGSDRLTVSFLSGSVTILMGRYYPNIMNFDHR
ncbi:hypothetical protein EVA_12531 [gut metagenome]|uniref:Uncharacterized protein n=1 Tax=gut metagenome TaxID=749906 RepID=J9GC64_9ZZZZ